MNFNLEILSNTIFIMGSQQASLIFTWMRLDRGFGISPIPYTQVFFKQAASYRAGKVVYYNTVEDAERIHLFFEAYGMKGIEKGFLEVEKLRVEGLDMVMKKRIVNGSRYSKE